MATKVTENLIDDIDGSEAVRTLRFGWEGVDYEIDLSEVHLEVIDEAVSPFVEAARRIGGPVRPGRSRRPRTNPRIVDAEIVGGEVEPNGHVVDASPDTVRRWAVANGFEVSNRGRISRTVMDAFRTANA